ncbi:hypothetical protein EGW08_011837 [Elysia chlorotica]|uniref:SMB domain-containing protein n=1 Tax=Elysia chlorotica TaxID=188477 RepID=A0A3S0ZJJ8_ELYCH|nr:hypothetical protein EGW08_011837 [Elysia chlorotica]
MQPRNDVPIDGTSTKPTGGTESTIEPVFTLQYARQNRECFQTATHFVYQHNLCGANDSLSYLDSNKHLYSCENRCGEKARYSDVDADQCSCDSICEVFGDCCRDKSLVCPKAYDAHLRKATTACSPDAFSIVYSCLASETAHFETATTDRVRPETQTFPGSTTSFSQPKSLKEISSSASSYVVADTSTGIIFKDFEMLKICGGPNAVPYYLPAVVSLDCGSVLDATSTGRNSAIQVLNTCEKRQMSFAITPFHRKCKQTHLVKCKCPGENTIVDHIHNACMGLNDSVPFYVRHKTLSYLLRVAFQWNDNLPCTTISFGPYKSETKGKALISISHVPMVLSGQSSGRNSASSHPQTDPTNTHHVPHSTDRSRRGHVSQSLPGQATLRQTNQPETGRLDDLDFTIVVEVSSALERRLLCRSLHSRLSECRLLDCARGAILSRDAGRAGDFGGSRCLVPSHAEVYGPLCWCLKVLVVLSDARAWVVKMRHFREGWCQITLDVFSQEEEPLEVFELAKSARVPEPRTTSTPVLSSLFDDMRKDSKCPQESAARLPRICLFFRESSASQSGDTVECRRLQKHITFFGELRGLV